MANPLARELTPSELDDGYLESHTKIPQALYAYQVIPNPRDQRAWGTEYSEFMQSGVENIYEGSGGRWYAVKPLGIGGLGRAGLWERRDDRGRLAEVCRPSHGINPLL